MAEDKSTKRGHRFKDLSGNRYGRLTVVRFIEIVNRAALWLCRCDCGNYSNVRTGSLHRGTTRSCGCLLSEVTTARLTKHGHALSTKKSRTYTSWTAAKKRCFDEKYDSYHRYGGRGITMCEEWRNSFEAFLCDMGERPEGTSIDRINNDGNYEPGNCRWAARKTQLRNTAKAILVEHNGEVLPLKELAERTGESYKRMHRRNQNGSTLLGPRVRRWHKKPKQ